MFEFNPPYPFLNELKALLEKALSFYPEEVRGRLLMKVEEESTGEKEFGIDTRQDRGAHPDSFEVEWD